MSAETSGSRGAVGSLRRVVARWSTWWIRLLVGISLVFIVMRELGVPVPGLPVAVVLGILAVLYYVRPPASQRAPARVGAPVSGRWVAINSPGQKVPSHIRAYGQAYAIDLFQLDPHAPTRLGWSLRGKRPEASPCFGRPVLAVADGEVVAVLDSQRDHLSRGSWPLLMWMVVDGLVRELRGATWILGNHVIIRHVDEHGAFFSVYAHLRRASTTVRPGERVEQGQPVAQVGNTGNSSEPHLHIQLMDRRRLTEAVGIPMLWPWQAADSPAQDPRIPAAPAKRTAQPGMPANGQVLQTG